jgi:hypothetical protein
MMYKFIFLSALMFFPFDSSEMEMNAAEFNANKITASVVKSDIDQNAEMVYKALDANKFELPKQESFTEALKGFYLLKEKGLIKKDILTLVDFSLSSNTKRLWVIDLKTNEVLFQSLVAHGRNTGEEFATRFSNLAQSFQSSLGFYATGEIYKGKHGLSLKLDGLEKGINDRARQRAVVVHGAEYVSDSFIKGNKRLGRSQGCPAVPVELASEIISAIKDKSCLYIHHPSIERTKVSKLTSKLSV